MPTFSYSHTAPPIGNDTVFLIGAYGSCEKVEVVDLSVGGSYPKSIYHASDTWYGVNGTFFVGGANTLTRMSMMNGQPIANQPNCDNNRVPAGTMLVYKESGSSILRTKVQRINRLNEFTGGTVKMAVGGIDLRLNETHNNETAFHDVLLASDGNGYEIRPQRHRTALVAFPNQAGHSNIALVTVFTFAGNMPFNPTMEFEGSKNGANAWQLRELIKTQYPNATGAVMLDGGGSTQMVSSVNGVRKGMITGHSHPTEGIVPRLVPTMIRTPWSW